MYSRITKTLAWLVVAALLLSAAVAQTAPGGYTVHVTSDLVLLSVVARDKSGALVRDLKAEDFTVLEDGKTQHIQSFDSETPETAAAQGPAQIVTSGAPPPRLLTGDTATREAVRDRRLVVIFFDVSSMQPDDVARSVKAARTYVERQMTAADLVAVITLGDSMRVEQDFTTDRVMLTKALDRLSAGEGQGFEEGTTGDSEGQPDTGAQFTADDTEYNLFNADRRLQAIASLAEVLGKIEQKKSVLYFSGGLTRTGIENQSRLRAAINAAVRANVSVYTVDARGLQALPPSGGAQTASLRGTAAYSGRAVQNQFDSNFASQETLSTLAADTGGKAFLDSNDLGKAFTRVQQDTAQYYVLAYRSSNKAMDGKYRRISVRVNRRDVKLEYRSGYYGPRDFQHFTREDRERQLEDEAASDLPRTDLPVYLATAYFRMEPAKFFVPVAVVVPGSALPAVTEKDKATLDVLGIVRDTASKMPVGNIRDTVKLAADAQPGARRNVQYRTGFMLPPGSYHLKLVVRENQGGRVGSFETDFTVPEFGKAPLKMSSVVLASQRVPATGKQKQNPLVRDGAELVPNIAHVFSTEQQLTLYFEVYDPVRDKAAGERPNPQNARTAHGANDKGAIRLLTSIQFFSGKVKTYETPRVEAHELNTPERRAAAFQLEVPLAELRPGWYTCQVNVIDDAAGTFSFPRIPLLIRDAKARPAQ